MCGQPSVGKDLAIVLKDLRPCRQGRKAGKGDEIKEEKAIETRAHDALAEIG